MIILIFLLKKLCWFELNIDFIFGISDLYKELKDNFKKEREDKQLELMKIKINNLNLKYITKEEKYPKKQLL